MSKLLNGLKVEDNLGFTENCAVTRKSTLSKLYDMFAFGAAYRNRSDADCILLFKEAYEENPVYALKCLFYIRDIRGGQGERRFWRVCARWLAEEYPETARRILPYVAEYGRYDDYYTFIDTPVENDMFALIKHQLALDVSCKTPSLLAKWLKSENTSSRESRRLASRTRNYLGMTSREYRLTLSALRERIRVVERLMSANRWDEIEFDKLPSQAGLIYRNAFARRDILFERYKTFMSDKNTKVNAGVLYPYEAVDAAYKAVRYARDDSIRLAANKYWDSMTDYFNGAELDALCVVDTSGSMTWGSGKALPINIAISLGLYAAERARGPFAGHYISFSSKPRLVEVRGVDFCDKVERIYDANLCENTNIEATFDLILNTALNNHCSQSDLPKTIVIISDMEFDAARGVGYYRGDQTSQATLMENISKKWKAAGYEMPKLVFWNVNARNDNIPMENKNGITFVSGASATTFEMLIKDKDGYDLMLDKLNSERYSMIK